jgi:heme/copper-type cytochrome/quinol oxidase subunit 1
LKYPNKLFWISIPLVWVIVFLINIKGIDIQFHYTYIVVGRYQVGLIFSVVLVLEGSLYWFAKRKKLNPRISLMHIGITLVSLILF